MKVLVVISLLVALTNAATTKAPIGGKIDADVNNAEVQDAAKFAYQMLSSSLNTVHATKMGKITKAQTQVVNGVAYWLTLEVQETDCAKAVTDLSNCKVIKTEKCDVEVVSRPWDTLHKKQLVMSSCSSIQN